MSRLLVVACVVALGAGCAHAISVTSSHAGETCGARGAPPAPRIDAVQDGHRIRVEYVVRRPAGCVADAVQIAVSSVAHPGNVGPSTTNGLVRLVGTSGAVEVDVPPLDLPPYEVRATSLAPRGRRSAVTALRLPHSGDQCRGERCLQRAREKLERCMRGLAARGNCPAYLWRTRPPVPYEPVQGVTRPALEKSFTSIAGSPVACASTSECLVEGVTFAVSGHRQRPGCWIAEHRLDRYRACVDWNWNQ